MHGKPPVKASPSRTRRAATWTLVLLVIAGVGYYFFAGSTDKPDAPRAAGSPRTARCRCSPSPPSAPTSRSISTPSVPHGAQHRNRAPASRWQSCSASISRKARTSRKARCWRRSIRPRSRRRSIRHWPRRRKTRRNSPTARTDLERYERLAATAAINKPAGRHTTRAGRSEHARWFRPTRLRSITRRQCSATRPSLHHSMAVPASAWWMKATMCALPTQIRQLW